MVDYWRVTTRQVATGIGVLQLAVVVLAVLDAIGVPIWYLRSAFAVVVLSVGPGALCLILVGLRDVEPIPCLLYSVGMSALLLMAVGVSFSLASPLAGIYRPMSEPWVLAATSILNLGLAALVLGRTDPTDVVTEVPIVRLKPAYLTLLIVLFGGILAVTLLNRFGTWRPVALYLVVLSLVPAYLIAQRHDSIMYPLAIWTSALSLLYFKSLWDKSYPLEMWMHQMVLEQGRWLPAVGGEPETLPEIGGMGQEGVLTDAVLYPMYSLTGGFSTMTQLQVVNPLLVAMVPLGMYAIFERYAPKRDAALAVFVFIFSFRFYSQHYPNAPRDVMATLFLVLLGLCIADPDLSERIVGALAPLFISGIAVSHYGTSYLFLAVLVISVPFLVVLNTLRSLGNRDEPTLSILTIIRSGVVIRYQTILFAGVFILTWYRFTGGGIKFQIVADAIQRVLSPVRVSGLASERVLSEKPVSIETTRTLIVVIFGLVGLGLVTEGLRKMLSLPSSVTDEHLAISVGFFGIFGLSFLSLGTGFGQGRIFMITLSYVALFAVLALYNLRQLSQYLVERYPSLSALTAVRSLLSPSLIRWSFAALLCAYLLINTGVVAETVTGGDDYGANIIVNNDRLAASSDPDLRIRSQGCIDCDIQSQVWILRHGDRGERVVHGGFSRSYYWYGHSLVSQLDDFVGAYLLENRSTLYKSELPADWSDVDSGSYVLLTHDNYDGRVVRMGDRHVSLASAEQSLARSDKVYTSGDSTVYAYHNASGRTAADTQSTGLTWITPVPGPRQQ